MRIRDDSLAIAFILSSLEISIYAVAALYIKIVHAKPAGTPTARSGFSRISFSISVFMNLYIKLYMNVHA